MNNPHQLQIEELTSNGRIIVIGDLHGMHKEALELLSACELTPEDSVIFTGDLVDRGPEPAECVDLAMKHHCILGNHEDKHLQYHRKERQSGHVDVNIPTHIETRKHLRNEHYDYFETLPNVIMLPQHGAAVVHAGVMPWRPLKAQDPHTMMHVQMVKKGNTSSKWPSKAPQDWSFWTNSWRGPERLIFGHTCLSEPLISEFAVGIDGGACFGRELWAVELPSWRIIRVKSNRGGDSPVGRGRTNKRINAYPVHGTVCAFS